MEPQGIDISTSNKDAMNGALLASFLISGRQSLRHDVLDSLLGIRLAAGGTGSPGCVRDRRGQRFGHDPDASGAHGPRWALRSHRDADVPPLVCPVTGPPS